MRLINFICIALIIIVSLIFVKPISADAPQIKLYQEALIYYDNGLFAKSLELIDKALLLNPYYKECYNLKGLIYAKTDLSDSAEINFKRAIELDKFFTKAIYDLSAFYLERDFVDSAIMQINIAIAADSANINFRALAMECLLHLKKYDEFLKHYEFVEKLNPEFSISKFLYGKYFEKTGDLEQAKKYYKLALDAEYLPFIPQPYLALANILFSENKIDDAIYFYENAVKHPEIFRKAQIQLAKIYNHIDESDKVIKLWDVFPSYYLNAYHIGLAYYKKAIEALAEGNSAAAKKMLDSARNFFEGALKINDEDEFSRFMLEKILLRVEPVNSPVRKKYSDYHKYFGLQALYERGKPAQALLNMQRAIRLDPQDTVKRFELAKYYQKQKNIPAAIEEYNRIIDIDNTNIDAKDNRDLIKYEFDAVNKELKDFTSAANSNQRIKLVIKIHNNLNEILHSNFIDALEEWLTNISEVTFKFDFYFAPRQFDTIDQLEQYVKTIDADGLLELNFFQTDDSLKTKARILNFSDIKEKAQFSIDKPRRSPDLLTAEKKISFSGKQKILNTTAEIYNFIDNYFPVIAKIEKTSKYKFIINAGYYQGLKKGDKLTVVSRALATDKKIGDAVVSDIVGHYALCDLNDWKTAANIKVGDIVFFINTTNK